MEKKKYYTLKDIIKIDAKLNVLKAFAKYGIEKTEDVIKSVYKLMPKAKKYMLKRYKELLRDRNVFK